MKIVMISKALEEVWEWKEKCYEESKGMTMLDYLKRFTKIQMSIVNYGMYNPPINSM